VKSLSWFPAAASERQRLCWDFAASSSGILVFAKRLSRSNSRADAGNSYYPHPIAILGVSPGLLPVAREAQ
jgi:hypothetical protein